MAARFRFHRLALDANEGRTNVRDVDALPIPTLDERVDLYLRAIHGNRKFTEEERSNARNALLDSMAAEIAAQAQPEVTEPRPLHQSEAPTQYWQSVRRKETIRAVPIASRRTSILALTATLGLLLIVTGGTLGYRWTHPHIGEEVLEPSQQDRVAPPTTSPRSLSTRPAPDKAAPEQHVVRIVSQRSEADVLAVFRRLQEEQPTLFGQATLKRIDLGLQSAPRPLSATPAAADRAGDAARREGPYIAAQVGPFASEKDAAAVCRAFEAADIQCVGQRQGGASD